MDWKKWMAVVCCLTHTLSISMSRLRLTSPFCSSSSFRQRICSASSGFRSNSAGNSLIQYLRGGKTARGKNERESVEFNKAWNGSPCYMKTMSASVCLATAIFCELWCYKGASNLTSFTYRSANKFASWFDSRLTWQDDKSESGSRQSNSETCYAVTVNLHFVSVIQYKKGVKNEHVTVPSISHGDSASAWQTARSARNLTSERGKLCLSVSYGVMRMKYGLQTAQ